MVLKWMALGFKNYFTSFWTILDFIIVFVSANAKRFLFDHFLITVQFLFQGICFLVTNRRKWKSSCTSFVTNTTGIATAESDISMARNANRSKCIDVRNTIDFQCPVGVSRFLVDIFDYGRAVFRWKIFQMRWRRGWTAAYNGISMKKILIRQMVQQIYFSWSTHAFNVPSWTTHGSIQKLHSIMLEWVT